MGLLSERGRTIGLLAIILIIAGIFRFTGLAWDDYQHHHPDERFISWVATTIEAPDSLATAFSPHQSTFNPYYWHPNAESRGVIVPQDEQRAFAYGHLPLYAGVMATRLAGWVGKQVGDASLIKMPASWRLTTDVLNTNHYTEYNHITIVGRVLTALVDLGTILLIFLLGRRVYGVGVGLLAAGFLAINVMHIQLAHFFTTDPYVTFFSVAAITSMVWAIDLRNAQYVIRNKYIWLASILIGLAIGSKFAGIFLFIPLFVLVWFGGGTRSDAEQGREGTKRLRIQKIKKLVGYGLVAVVAFGVTNPFALLDWTCEVSTPAVEIAGISVPELNLGSCFLQNVAKQSAIVSGAADIGFARQYAGTLPYLYFIEMQLKWGMSPILGITAFTGLLWLTFQQLKTLWSTKKKLSPFTIHSLQFTILLSWTLSYILLTGYTFVKFPRYWQPITPFLMLFGAVLVWQMPYRKITIPAILIPTTAYALAFMSIYNQPHPWNNASEWLFRNAKKGAIIHTEQWDELLPLSLIVDGQQRNRNDYQQLELTWLTFADEKDTPERLELNLAKVAQADYLTIASNRIYGVVPRLPNRFPLSSQFHELLFSGELGFEVVYVAGREMEFAGISLTPNPFNYTPVSPPTAVANYLADQTTLDFGRFDESFTVYDQPLVFIFANKQHQTVPQMLQKFDIP